MKQYGAKKATDFTEKQISVIYANAKRGALKVEKWFLNELYDLATYIGYDDNRSVERDEKAVKEILEAVFANEIEKAQSLIDYTTNDWYNSYGRKTQEKCDRNVFVA